MPSLADTRIWIAVERGALGAADIHAVTRQQLNISDTTSFRKPALRCRAPQEPAHYPVRISAELQRQQATAAAAARARLVGAV